MAVHSMANECGFFARFSFHAACRLIDMQHQRGKPFPSRFPLKMLQYSADHGHVSAMSQLGSLLYQCGVGRVDKRNGLEYIRHAAKSGDVDAQFMLGKAYAVGKVTPPNPSIATHWLALAADRGHQEAAEVLREVAARN